MLPGEGGSKTGSRSLSLFPGHSGGWMKPQRLTDWSPGIQGQETRPPYSMLTSQSLTSGCLGREWTPPHFHSEYSRMKRLQKLMSSAQRQGVRGQPSETESIEGRWRAHRTYTSDLMGWGRVASCLQPGQGGAASWARVSVSAQDSSLGRAPRFWFKSL